MAFKIKTRPIFIIILLIPIVLLLFANYKKRQFIAELAYLQLPEFTLTTSHTNINLIKREVILEDATITSNIATDSIHLTIPALRIHGISYLDYLFTNTVSADSLIIEQPQLMISPNDSIAANPLTERDEKKPTVQITQFIIRSGALTRKNANQDTITQVHEMNAQLKNLVHNGNPNEKPQMTSYNVEFQNIQYKPTALSTLFIDSVLLTTARWNIKKVTWKPDHDKITYGKFITYQDDWIAATIDELTISNPDINQITDSVFTASHIAINHLKLDVFRDKHLPRKNNAKPMISSLINTLPFKFSMDSILVNNGEFTYGERLPGKTDYGNISLSNIQTKINRINTIIKDTMAITFRAQPIGQGHIQGSLLLPLSSVSDEFYMQLAMKNIDFSSFNSFTETNMNLANTGIIHEAFIHTIGNNQKANGRSYLNYEDLHIRLLNKRSGNEKKVLSSLANLLVHKDRNTKNDKAFTVERNQYRSFFNYIWLCTQKGMQVNML